MKLASKESKAVKVAWPSDALRKMLDNFIHKRYLCGILVVCHMLVYMWMWCRPVGAAISFDGGILIVCKSVLLGFERVREK